MEGHTDSVGSDQFNLKLSERRATSVMKVLVTSGIPQDKIARIGFGESMPIADNGNFQGRELNRRVEIRVLKLDGGEESSAKNPLRLPKKKRYRQQIKETKTNGKISSRSKNS